MNELTKSLNGFVNNCDEQQKKDRSKMSYFRRTLKFIPPIAILIIFGLYSYSIQTKSQQNEADTYISLLEFSKMAEKEKGTELPFWNKVMISLTNWIMPVNIIDKNESLKLLKITTSNTTCADSAKKQVQQTNSINR